MCPNLVIQEAQKREEDEGKKQNDGIDAPTSSTQDPKASCVPAPGNTITPNPTPLPAASTAIQPEAGFPGHSFPNTAFPQPYGALTMIHTSPATINPFPGFGPHAFQTGYDHRLSPFPQVTNQYFPPTLMTPAPYANVPGPNYQYARPYENVYPPVYSPANRQSTGIPYTPLPPAFSTNRSLSGSLRRPRSPSPAVEIEDPLDYPDLSD